MLTALVEPFTVPFVIRALLGGVLLAAVCALVGVWVIARGMTFLGEAMSHGMLPGVAVASILGGSLVVGAATSAFAMALGVNALRHSREFGRDTSIGLLFVGLLSIGVIVVSHSRSFATDLTAFLFGDVLAIRSPDLLLLAAAALVVAGVTAVCYRPFLALTFDARKARTLGLRPDVTNAVMLTLLTITMAVAFSVVGTLLAFGMLIAPSAAAMLVARRLPVVMLTAFGIGTVATVIGLWISWFAATAAGATIAAVAVLLFFLILGARRIREASPRGSALTAAAMTVVLTLSGCASADEPVQKTDETPHGYVAGAEELPEPQSAIAYASLGSRRLRLLDLITETEKVIELPFSARRIVEDGRFVYVTDGDRRLEIVDAGVWTVDHGDHVHYYRAPARSVGTITFATRIETIVGSEAHTTIGTADGRVTVIDRRKLGSGEIVELARIASAGDTPLAVPYADQLLVAADGRLVATDAGGAPSGALDVPCAAPRGWAVLRAGAVIACDSRIVRIKRQGERLMATTTAVPRAPIPPNGFVYRPRSNEAAVADRSGIWSVHAAEATVRYVAATGRRLAVAASPADGSTVLALDESGALTSYDLATGTALRTVPVLASSTGASLTLDINRAYLTEPRARLIHEIDYRDGLRTARTLRAADQPDLAVEVGR
ncbi:zinc ABC transporter permease AztB [Cryptosporangium aurantiacum]|nr:zinc ABC transporter permease AztB [Cryptosporangium aurantiacum]